MFKLFSTALAGISAAGLAVLAITGFAGPATATPVTFNLTGSMANAPSYTFTDVGSGLVLTLSPLHIDDVSTPTLSATLPSHLDPAAVTQSSSGVGVYQGDPENAEIDGSGWDDALQMDFSSAVKLLSITMIGGSTDESYYYFEDADGDGNLSGDVVGGPFALGTSPLTVSLASLSILGADFFGETFGVGTICQTCTFRVSEIQVEAVPLPASLPLFAGGLGGLGFMSWWRKRKRSAVTAA